MGQVIQWYKGLCRLQYLLQKKIHYVYTSLLYKVILEELSTHSAFMLTIKTLV